MVKKLNIFTDGGSRGNPGNAASAFIIEDGEGNVLKKHSESLGIKTNNEAEYTAIIRALEAARKFSKGEINFFSDSKLAVNQINSTYKIKKKHLKELFLRVKKLEENFKSVTFSLLPRTNRKISRVDELVNEELDRLE